MNWDKKNKTLIFGSAAFIALLVLSIIFYKHRTIFLDLAFHSFFLVKDGYYAVQNNRFGAVFTQTFPLIGAKIGLSLEGVLKMYSVGFVLYYFGIFLLCTAWLKRHLFGLAVLLFCTFMVTDTFYWIQSEFPQGIAFLILYFAILSKQDFKVNHFDSKWHLPFHCLMLITVVFYHPLILFPFAFIWLFFLGREEINRALHIRIGLTFILLYLLKFFIIKTKYDDQSMGGIKNFITLFPDYFSIQSNKDFLNYLIQDYYLLPIGLIALTVLYRKKWKMLALVWVFFLSYLLLINVSYQGGEHKFYIENLYLPLSIFLIIPIVFDLFENIKFNYALLIIGLMVIIRTADIAYAHKPYSDRLDWMRNYLKKTESAGKIIVNEKDIPLDIYKMSWASSYEFWLLSTIEEGETRSIIIDEDPNRLLWEGGFNKKFVTEWGGFYYYELPSKYFILNDTTLYKVQ